jgi:hypothetical protein
MDTVNVSSQVRTIALTSVQYGIHYLCNANNTVFKFLMSLLINRFDHLELFNLGR